MPLNIAMSLMSAGEFLLWALLGFLFWTKGFIAVSRDEYIS